MKKLILFILLIHSIHFLKAQQPTFVWAKSTGGTSNDVGNSIAVDASGNVYTTGNFWGTADLDPTSTIQNFTSAGYNDIFISKTDNLGNLIWVKQIGGAENDIGYSIDVDQSGNIYITGVFSKIVDFDPSTTGTLNLTSNGVFDVFILKLDNSGNMVWANSIGSSGGDDYAYSIKVDQNGDLLIRGEFYSTVDFDPGSSIFNLTGAGTKMFLLKLNNSGNFIWAKNLGGNSAQSSNSIAIDNLGNIYISGNYTNTSDFDPGSSTYSLTSKGQYDIFITKLDPQGNFLWTKSMGGTGNDWQRSMTIDASGNLYITGGFFGTSDFDPNSGILNLTTSSGTNEDIFIVKLDESGNLLWAKSAAGPAADEGTSISIDALGDTYITGNFGGTVDFDPSSNTMNLISIGAQDMFILKLSSLGNLIWVKQIGAPFSSSDTGNSLIVNAGNIYVTGSYQGTTDFDPNTSTFNLKSNGGNDIFILKINVCTTPSSPTSSNISICSGNNASLSATGIGTLKWYDQVTNGNLLETGATYTTTSLTTTTKFYVEDNTTCGTSSRTEVTVTVNSLPTISINGTTNVCDGQATTLTASGATSYSWNSGQTTSSITFVPTTGSYSVTGTDASNCSNTTSTMVNVDPLPILTIEGETTICKGESTILTASGAKTYSWSSGGNNAEETVSPNTQTTYIVTGTNIYNCSNTEDITVTVNTCTDIANSISPTFVNLYPNPTSGQFKIKTTDVADQIVITNVVGETVVQIQPTSESTSFDIAPFEKGIYFVKVITKEKSQTLKITKQ